MIPLRAHVEATILRPGEQVATTIRGKVYGRTRERHPRYTIRAEDGMIYHNCPAVNVRQLKENLND